MYLKAAPYYADDDKVHLSVRQMKMDFSVKDIKMGVDGIHNGNAVLRKFRNSTFSRTVTNVCFLQRLL